MTQTVLVYASRRQRERLSKQGFVFLAEYDDYVLTDVTPSQLADLRAQGYEVEVQERPEIIEVRGRSVSLLPDEQLRRGVRSAAEGAVYAIPQGPSPETFGPGYHYYLVQFVGPVKEQWLEEVREQGGRPLEPMPPYGYSVALDPTSYRWLITEPKYVRWVGHYSADLRVDSELTSNIDADPVVSRGPIRGEYEADRASAPAVERIPTTFTVRFFESELVPIAIPHIVALGGMPSDYEAGATIITVSFAPDEPDLRAKVQRLAHLHGVQSVEAFSLRQLYNSVCIGLMGAEEVISPTGLGLSGRGEIVAVADSGLDTGDPATIHPDFAGRVAAIHSWPVAAGWAAVVTNRGGDDGSSDTRSGHGTHVSGSVCGDGSAAAEAQAEVVRGLAAEAQLVFQAIEQTLEWTDAYRQEYYRRYRRYPPAYGLAGLPADLTGLFQQAYDAGARVHNNSWGGGGFGVYDEYAEAVDRFMWEHKDFLILFAAGNDGTDADRDGIVDDGSLTPPGTAKNCITVGAAESLRTQGGYQRGYGRLWPSDFPADPLLNDRPSDNADDIAAFSSRGPTRDRRIKPDLVAPGTNVVSTRSQALDPARNGWGRYSPPAGRYMFDGGTSMATPLVTGATAVVRQYLRTIKRRRNPSAALIKATLIHAARYQQQRHVPTSHERYYDHAQGWGHLDLSDVLNPDESLEVRWYARSRGLSSGQSWRWSCFVTDDGLPLAFTLAWTDYPSSAGHYPNLVNDLDLLVTSPSGQVYYGNNVGPGGSADRINNMERIIIPQPERGHYRIRVRAFNVPRGPQDFALVYSGGLG